MKFQVVKHDCLCKACNTLIFRGEDMVVTAFHRQNFKLVLTYHLNCYLPWYTNMFNQKWQEWKMGTGRIERKKLGRKPTYEEPNKEQVVNRLRSNISYHKSAGHSIKVGELQAQLKRLLRRPVH